MAYRKHIKSSSSFLQEYEILEENRLFDTYIQYVAYHKQNKDLKFFINRETAEKSSENIARIDALIKSKEIGLTLINDIFIEPVNSMLLVYTVIPFLTENKQILSDLLSNDSLSNSQKLRIFQNLSNSISALHDLGVPHLELSPDSIIIENKTIVYLKAFRIMPDVYAEDFYYTSPEVLSGIPYFLCQFGGDVWSLGCIYAELFISLTPLFQAPSPQEKLLRMFEVLGVPQFQDVEDYITWENYKEIKSLAIQTNEPIKNIIFNSLTGKEREIFMNMLCFAVDKRIDSKAVASFPWKDEESYLESVTNDIIPGPYEYEDNPVIKSGYSSFKLPLKHEKMDSFEYKKSEELPKPVLKTPDLELDNTLYISIQSAINLDLFKYQQDSCCLIFSFDLDILNTIHSSTTAAFKAASSIQISYKTEIPINSEDFKKKYRTNPLLIKVSQSLTNGNKKREDVLGVCEAYLGLLFGSTNTGGNSDNSVTGWYHIISGKEIIGQLLLEIKTKKSISQAETLRKTQLIDPTPYADRSLIKEITQDLGDLTAKLKAKDECKIRREQE